MFLRMNTEGGMIKFVKNNKVVDFDITDVHLCGLGSGVFKFQSSNTVFFVDGDERG